METHKETLVPPKPDVKVVSVTSDQYTAFRKNYQTERVHIEMDTWNEAPTNSVILNYGAGPCLILYAISPQSTISGHFSLVNGNDENYSLDLTQQVLKSAPETVGIQNPTVKQIDLLGRGMADVHNTVSSYKAMIERIASLSEQYGSQQIDIYLFGQNITVDLYGEEILDDKKQQMKERLRPITKDLIARAHVDADVSHIGIPHTAIHDYRRYELNFDNADDKTIYVPSHKAIYHLHQAHPDMYKTV